MKKTSDTRVEQIELALSQKEQIRQLKAKKKIEMKRNKRSEKEQLKKEKSCNKWFSFFTKWFYLGLVFVLLSICLSLCIEQFNIEQLDKKSFLYMALPVLTVFSNLLSTVGIALFVGCVFDFSKNSEAFITFVSNILSDIVVSKKFLSTLSKKDKEQALNLILKPMDSQVEQYANINNFFKKKIRETMSVFDTEFKTNVVLNVEAHKDLEKNIVYCETTSTYTIYKLNNKFNPIKVMFEKDSSNSNNFRVISPDGEEIEDIEMHEQETCEIAGIKYTIYETSLPESCGKHDHLTVKMTVREPGHDHWINFYWQSLTPYEGISCRVKCYNELSIKDFMIFDNKAYYAVELSEDCRKMDITSSQWLDEDTGFSLVISE